MREGRGAPVVDVADLVKDFKKLRAVDGVSFTVSEGEIVGLLGPNGAGKTTIIHMLLGLTTPTSGRVRVFGLDFGRHRSRILQEVNFSSTYTDMPYSLTVQESLRVFARLYGVRRREEKIRGLLETFGLTDIRRKQVRHLSTGQRTRLNLSKALVNDPRVLFLDEPTASLDPDIADKTRKLLKRVKEERGISILYTSHNMIEMEEVSDRVLFLHRGRLLAEGTPAEVVRSFRAASLEDAFLKVARGKDAGGKGTALP
ncbi:MAG: ABC transporter ATP-binding protein [Candidatus Aminicenantes bacterium]|nr:ABC transporter ATP-binding protein [Candidatus Aminicenantes bacterium]